MKQRTFILTFFLTIAIFTGCHNNKAQGYVETKNENSEKKVCTVPCERNDTILWDNWFKENHKWYIHIFDETKEKHTKTINDLLSLFYTGNDSLRNNYRMIEWRLDRFYPIIDDTSSELIKYNNIAYLFFKFRRKFLVKLLLCFPYTLKFVKIVLTIKNKIL